MNEFPAQQSQIRRARERAHHALAWDNVRAQNGPGIAELELWPGPDLSASLGLDEEH